LDKLVLEIETNGAVSAEDAVRALPSRFALEGNELAAFDAPVQRSSQQFDPILLRRWMSLS
jgi:DNA-directed RNA polymerase subunit alpha